MKSTLRSRHTHIGLLKSLPFLGISILLLVSCNPQAEQTTFDQEEVKQAVKQTLENYFKDIAKDGLTAEFKYLDNSPDFFWVPPGYSSALSYDSVRAILTQNAPNFKKNIFYWEQLQLYPHSAEITSYTGIVNASVTDTTGVETKSRIIESGTMILRKDGWKILNGQSRLLPE